MSHKIATPPGGPFSGGQVVVDKSSTSQIEEGSWQNPYKTIQAALDAMPAPVSIDTLVWSVIVVSGLYEEDLVLPPSGYVALSPVTAGGLIILGDPTGVARSIVWDPVNSGLPAAAKLTGFLVTGDITVTTVTNDFSPSLTLANCQLSNGVNTGLISDPGLLTIDFDGCEVEGSVTVDAIIAGRNSSFAGVTCYNLDRMYDSQFQGELTTTGDGSQELKRCGFNTNLTFNGTVGQLEDLDIGGNLNVLGAPGAVGMRSVTVGGTSILTDIDVIDSGNFDGALSLLGTRTPRVYSTRFGGLVTCTVTPFDVAYTSVFYGGITLGAVPSKGFFGCHIEGNINGPVGAYKVDSATVGSNTPSLVPPVTRALLGPAIGTPSTKTVTTAVIAGGGAAFEDFTVSGVPNQAVLVGVFAQLLAGTSANMGVVAWGSSADMAAKVGGTEIQILGDGSFPGVAVPPVGWTVGPYLKAVGRATVPLFNAAGSNQWYITVYNLDGANAGTFEVRLAYLDTTISLA